MSFLYTMLGECTLKLFGWFSYVLKRKLAADRRTENFEHFGEVFRGELLQKQQSFPKISPAAPFQTRIFRMYIRARFQYNHKLTVFLHTRVVCT